MKLGKKLDLDKFFYDKDHWTHPDLKEEQLYIVCLEEIWALGKFELWKPPYSTKWNFKPAMYSNVSPQLSYGKNPKDEEWTHIQEVIE